MKMIKEVKKIKSRTVKIKKSLRFLILSSFLSFFSFSLFSQIPQGYYNTIDSKQERELKTALHQILKNHTVLSYNSLWYYFRTTDVKDDGITVWDMYSNIVRRYSTEGGSVSGMNREHSLPKSWWATSGQVENYAAYSDLNHLYPSDDEANGKKSNYILGEINSPSFNNGVSKVGKNTYNYSGSPSANAFEPADEYKGDFARTYLYMVTCYENYAQQWRSDGLNMFNNETYPVLKSWAKDMLLKWHRADPVGNKERIRNEEVYIYQNNRNPFIDFPELAEYIWGNKTDEAFKVPEDLILKDPALISPVNLSEIYFGEIQKNSLVENTLLLKGINLTGNLTIVLWGTGKDYFNLSAESVPAVLVNSEEGYALKISYNPTEYGEHNASIIIQDGGISGSTMVSIKGVCTEHAAIVPVGANYPDLCIQGNEIIYRAYSPNNTVAVLDLQGRTLYKNQCTGYWESFHAASPGMYIIKINNHPRKVLVKE
ncbi:MAG: endonuclease [Dysgonamonadaceae bacterium]|jgi:endonuclease I|nr:endonuclease [Dysgonamonadaceae bacterium]